MTDKERAVYMLRIAADYVRKTGDKGREIFYDEALCDGYCVIDDCESAADMLEESK
jgi:hypothetical protein